MASHSSCAISAHSHAIGQVSFLLQSQVPAGFVQDPPPPSAAADLGAGTGLGPWLLWLPRANPQPQCSLLRVHSPDDGQNPSPTTSGHRKRQEIALRATLSVAHREQPVPPPRVRISLFLSILCSCSSAVKHRSSGKWLLSSGCPCGRL